MLDKDHFESLKTYDREKIEFYTVKIKFRLNRLLTNKYTLLVEQV